MKHQFRKGIRGKIQCPYCHEKSKFTLYEPIDGNELRDKDGNLCGKCERSNSCGVWIKPDGSTSFNRTETKILPNAIILSLDHSQKENVREQLKNQTSNFHKFALGLGITPQHLRTWGIGTSHDKTVFVFIDHSRNPCNVKTFRYKEDGHRDKEFGSYSLKSSTVDGQEYKYKICLFGEHLLSKDNSKFVVMVESEKTACIASFHYPQYDWLACCAGDGLTDDKAQILKGHSVIWLCDADKKGRDNSSLRTLKRQRITHKVVDLKPLESDGSDIADYILKGESINLQKAFMIANYKSLDDKPYTSTIRPRNYLKVLLERRVLDVSPNVFKNVMSESILKDIRKLESFIGIRVEKTENVYDLEFLALIESVMFSLKVAYHTESTFNRDAWMKETLRNNRIIGGLREELAFVHQSYQNQNRKILNPFQSLPLTNDSIRKIGTQKVQRRNPNASHTRNANRGNYAQT